LLSSAEWNCAPALFFYVIAALVGVGRKNWHTDARQTLRVPITLANSYGELFFGLDLYFGGVGLGQVRRWRNAGGKQQKPHNRSALFESIGVC
jgi:hypothetical protein